MIDIHSHILPNIDDGAQTFTDSLAMAKQAEKEGIHTIIATPHHHNGQYTNKKSSILTHVASLNTYLKEQDCSVKILAGQENRIYGELLEDYAKGDILTLADSKYIFIEFPSSSIPRYAKQLLFDIQLQGLYPIIVHPERNREILEHPDRLYELVKNGTATQLTASSITGHFGKKIKKFSEQLVRANLVHFVASDTHNTTTRASKMNEALDVIESTFGTDTMFQLIDNATLLVEGNHIYREVPQAVATKKFFGLF